VYPNSSGRLYQDAIFVPKQRWQRVALDSTHVFQLFSRFQRYVVHTGNGRWPHCNTDTHTHVYIRIGKFPGLQSVLQAPASATFHKSSRGLPGSDAVYCCCRISTFQRYVLPTSSLHTGGSKVLWNVGFLPQTTRRYYPEDLEYSPWKHQILQFL